jgi:hypothetical protein
MIKIDNAFKNLFKSTLMVVLISTMCAFGGFLFGLNFYGIFFIVFSLQYILFFCISQITKSAFVEKTKQKELDKLENLSTILNCAYCNKNNIMIFTPNDNNRIEFKCDHCEKTNVVTMQFLVARVTDSINLPTVTGIPLEN